MRYLTLVVFLFVVVLAAYSAGQFPAGEWYFTLNKPDWTPPPWLFGPVWSILYALMAWAMWLVWESGSPARIGALIWWLLQLVLNAAWSWLFFGLERIGWAMAEMAVLICFVVLCSVAFARISRIAGWLMVPYLAWLCVAFSLNVSIWLRNGGGLGSILG